MDQIVEINEDLVEKLILSKDDVGIDTMERVKILEVIAEVCMYQGEYYLVIKKFIQVGNKIKVCIFVWNILGNIVILYIIVVKFFFFINCKFVVRRYKQCIRVVCKYRFKN